MFLIGEDLDLNISAGNGYLRPVGGSDGPQGDSVPAPDLESDLAGKLPVTRLIKRNPLVVQRIVHADRLPGHLLAVPDDRQIAPVILRGAVGVKIDSEGNALHAEIEVRDFPFPGLDGGGGRA